MQDYITRKKEKDFGLHASKSLDYTLKNHCIKSYSYVYQHQWKTRSITSETGINCFPVFKLTCLLLLAAAHFTGCLFAGDPFFKLQKYYVFLILFREFA